MATDTRPPWAGMSWAEIAEAAYRAYAANTGNKNFRGDPMPEWAALPEAIRTAWQAAVREAADCYAHQAPPDDFTRWAGWTPPE